MYRAYAGVESRYPDAIHKYAPIKLALNPADWRARVLHFCGNMVKHCPHCHCLKKSSDETSNLIRNGYYRRKSDSKRIQRFQCLKCQKHFSSATFHAYYQQNKRHLNYQISLLLCSGVSQRRMAKILGISRTTVLRKLKLLGTIALETLQADNLKTSPAEVVEFDDMETFEHTKCKPLSITLAVEKDSRRILGFTVARMKAKGHLTKKAQKKYGFRKDTRNAKRRELFEKLKPLVSPLAVIKSDENPHYVEDVKKYFPTAIHDRYKGQRGSTTGQGELKKIRFDPLFSINHTCAMLRANMNRLFRKTWCTTKKPQNLIYHIAIYAVFHNFQLIESS